MSLLNHRLSSEQRLLVEKHLYLVNQVLNSQILYSTSYPDMNREELYQTGCLALCKAAIYYDPERPFAAYAARAIRNALYDYCKKITAYHRPLCTLEHLPELPVSEDPVKHLNYNDLSDFLKRHEKDYSDTVRKGIYALLKRELGYTSGDIAKDFGVSPNLVRAWISLASKKLRQKTELKKLLA